MNVEEGGGIKVITSQIGKTAKNLKTIPEGLKADTTPTIDHRHHTSFGDQQEPKKSMTISPMKSPANRQNYGSTTNMYATQPEASKWNGSIAGDGLEST